MSAVQYLTKDPDRVLPEWLEEGFPMGLAKAIQPGGLFPRQAEDSALTLSELDGVDRWQRNHPRMIYYLINSVPRERSSSKNT